jgi:transposase
MSLRPPTPWAPYDQFTRARHQQCLVHLLRRANELIEQQGRLATRVAQRIRAFLQNALDLRDRRGGRAISDHGFAAARGRPERRLDRLLSMRSKVLDFATCCQNGLDALDVLSGLVRHPVLKPAASW